MASDLPALVADLLGDAPASPPVEGGPAERTALLVRIAAALARMSADGRRTAHYDRLLAKRQAVRAGHAVIVVDVTREAVAMGGVGMGRTIAWWGGKLKEGREPEPMPVVLVLPAGRKDAHE